MMEKEIESVTDEELIEILADASGMTVEEFKEETERLDLSPPWKAEIIEDHGERQ